MLIGLYLAIEELNSAYAAFSYIYSGLYFALSSNKKILKGLDKYTVPDSQKVEAWIVPLTSIQ